MEAKRILLVEDGPDDIELTLRALKRHGVVNEIVVARDGAEALECLFGSETTGPSDGPDNVPQLILLDLKLPRIDGFEVLRRVRADARTRSIPVVILTSSREDRDLEECYRLGANSYIRKPVSFVEFAEAVSTVHLYWLVLNEPPPVTGVSRAPFPQNEQRAEP